MVYDKPGETKGEASAGFNKYESSRNILEKCLGEENVKLVISVSDDSYIFFVGNMAINVRAETHFVYYKFSLRLLILLLFEIQ